MTRKALRSVLTNFLKTYTSRYSDSDGWWIFGLIAGDLDGLDVDLLSRGKPIKSSVGKAAELARKKFLEQLAKHDVLASQLREARLTAESLGEKTGIVNGKAVEGHEVRFKATAITDLGKRYTSDELVFVAPHSAAVERQSMRATSLSAKIRRLKYRVTGG